VDEDEFGRWITSAQATLNSAVKDLRGGEYNWACFKSHQAAEKALKALLWGSGNPRYGHSLKKLYDALEGLIGGDDRIKEDCLRLDKYYTSTRYPDVWESGMPEEYFSESEALEAIRRAEEVLSWVKARWESLKKGSA